jgi:exportin-5
MDVDDHPEYPVYYEAVKELHTLSSHELRRLAMRYADYFSVGLKTKLKLNQVLMFDFQTFYDILEPKIREIASLHQMDDKLQTELSSVLLIIMYVLSI